MDTLRFNYQRFRQPQLSSLTSINSPLGFAAWPGQELSPHNYLVFTLNRKALLADETNLKNMLCAICDAAGDTPIIAPLRGKALEIMTRLISSALPLTSRFFPLPSLSYLEFGWLTAHAKGIITDSGNVAEEATFNGVPCITLNRYTEHQETVTVGSNVLVGEDPQQLREEVERMVSGQWKKSALPDRWDGRTAERIVKILLER
jgi:UDP-N-acetylglucosamine 2-epimerase (non-hydrolysing)